MSSVSVKITNDNLNIDGKQWDMATNLFELMKWRTLEAPLICEYHSNLSPVLRQGMLGILDDCKSGKTHVSPDPDMLQYT